MQKKKYSYTKLKEQKPKGTRLLEVLVLLPQGTRKKYSAIGEENIKNKLPKGKKVWRCWCRFMSEKNKPRIKLTDNECAIIFGEGNVIRTEEKIRIIEEKKNPSKTILDRDIRVFHMGIQLPNGEKKGAQVVVRHKNQNGIMDVRAMLKNGVRLTSCTCETRDGYRQQLTDGEMVAIFGKENVITKEARRKAEAQKRWEKHCIKKRGEIRPPADKYL